MHLLIHITHAYIHMHMRMHTSPPSLCGTDVLLILVPFFQDDSGWQQVETSLSENKRLSILTLDGCDGFVVNMLTALTMGKNISIQHLLLYSELLFLVSSHDISLVFTMYTVSSSSLSFGSATIPFVLYVPSTVHVHIHVTD